MTAATLNSQEILAHAQRQSAQRNENDTTPTNVYHMRPGAIVARIVGYILMLAIGIFMILPFIWMALSSVKPDSEVYMVPVKWLPSVWQWHNYVDIWTQSHMLRWIGNTLLLAVLITFIQVFTSTLAAYGFSKIHFRGRNLLFLTYIATMAVPWQAYMIPQYKMLASAGLADTRTSLVLLGAFSAFGVFMMKQFYDSIPEELSEAARLDGLSEWGIYTRIILPLSGPSIAALTILTFTGAWNDYMGPLIYLRSDTLWTIQIGLKSFIGQYGAQYGLIMTGSVLATLPIILLFLLGQRYFVEGIATTGMKG